MATAPTTAPHRTGAPAGPSPAGVRPAVALAAVLTAGLAAIAIVFLQAASASGVLPRPAPPPVLEPFEAPDSRVLPSSRPQRHMVLIVDDPALFRVLRARDTSAVLLHEANAGTNTSTEVLLVSKWDNLDELVQGITRLAAHCAAAGDPICSAVSLIDLRGNPPSWRY
jgi:hypothetical protein